MFDKINLTYYILSDIQEFWSIIDKNYSCIFIVVDENTKQFCLCNLLNINRFNVSYELIELKSGEINKTIDACNIIWTALSNANADRNSLIINLGGGVLCDISGFAASTYKRGISFINVPTTLLAMADAAFGGKTGFNFGHYKNQIGVFSLPVEVFIYPEFLKTLPEDEIQNGYAEIIKHALIKDVAYLKVIKNEGLNNLTSLIETSLEIKKTIVEEDLFENNIRKILNFGHTIGHAIEMLSPQIFNRQISHGQAVAAGMICELYISFKTYGISEEVFFEVIAFIKGIFEPLSINREHFTMIYELMLYDKKNTKGEIKMVLLKSIGEAIFNVNVSKLLIFESLDFYSNLK